MNDYDQDANRFYATLRVILHTPITLVDTTEKSGITTARGYYVNVGVTAADSNAAVGLLEGCVTDGDIDWKESVWTEGANIDPAIVLKAVGVPTGKVWYKSGRTLFP